MPTNEPRSTGLHDDTDQGEPLDPLAEAELLRTQFQEALARTIRLIASLKLHRRQSRAVQAAVESLRRLNPHGGLL